MGAKQYNKVSFTGEGDYFKSYLYIAGANHGQFNTLWGKYDLPSPISEILNVENLMSKEKQQSILEIFTKKFLDVTLKGEDKYKGLFYEVQNYRNILPETVYIQSYADSSYEMICNFEEDLDLTTGTMEGVSIDVSNVEEWTEKLSRFSNSSMKLDQDEYALALKWKQKNRAYVVIDLPSYNAEGRKLSFDIMDMNNADVKEKDYNLLDCTVVLVDANRKRATAVLSEHGTVYPPLPVRLSKLQFILGKNEYKHQFQTVSIPVEDFKKETGFDAKNIVKVQFLFDKNGSGNVRIDDVAFAD